MVCAPKGHTLIQFDFSQAESWIVAFLANEANMKKALMFGDIHLETAGSAIYFRNTGCEHEWDKPSKSCKLCKAIVTTDQRYIGKRVNHASAYRMKPYKQAQVINKDSDKPPYVTVTVAQTTEYNKGWHEHYNIRPWWAEIEQQMNINRTMITCYGRKRVFYAAWGEELFKEATAFEPQSTVADHANGKLHPELGIPGGFLQVHKTFVKTGVAKIINQAHDSIILETPSNLVDTIAPEVYNMLHRPIVLRGETFSIPVDCEVGERWGELEGYKIKHAA